MAPAVALSLDEDCWHCISERFWCQLAPGQMKTEIARCPYRVPGPTGALLCPFSLSSCALPNPGKQSVPGAAEHQTLPCPCRCSSAHALVHGWTSQQSLSGDCSPQALSGRALTSWHPYFWIGMSQPSIWILTSRVDSLKDVQGILVRDGSNLSKGLVSSPWRQVSQSQAAEMLASGFLPCTPERAAAALSRCPWCHWAVPASSRDIFLQTKPLVHR